MNIAPSKRDVSVAVIGAGLGGVAAAVKLKKAGVDNFTVFERSAGPGGVWYDNTYPGCEVDVHSHFYSYPFFAHDWTRTHARQPELLQYIEDTIDHFAVRDHFRFNIQIDGLVWNEDEHHWRLAMSNGEQHDFDVVISAVGGLSIPYIPDWPGLETFKGPKFHTSRWEHEHDLAGKRIAFVGVGSTGAQVVPALAEVAERLYVYQRQPGWVLPKDDREFTDEERERYMGSVLVRKKARLDAFNMISRILDGTILGSEANEAGHKMALAYLEEAVEDPEVRAALTPDYPLGCKRMVVSSTFLPTFNRPNTTLVPHAVERVTPTGVVSADGVEREVDVLVLGTGFQAQNFLGRLSVKGVGGRDLHEYWGDNPRAVASVMVPNFPNLFIMYGPNASGGGSLIYQLERGADVGVRAVKRMRRTGALSIDSHPAGVTLFTRYVDRKLARTASSSGLCTNYYVAPNGRNVVTWPGKHLSFLVVTLLFPWLFARTRYGQGKRWRLRRGR